MSGAWEQLGVSSWCGGVTNAAVLAQLSAPTWHPFRVETIVNDAGQLALVTASFSSNSNADLLCLFQSTRRLLPQVLVIVLGTCVTTRVTKVEFR